MRKHYSDLLILLAFIFVLGLLASAWPFLVLVWRIVGLVSLALIILVFVIGEEPKSEETRTGFFGTLIVDTKSPTGPVYTMIIEDDHLDPFFEEYDTVVMTVIRR